MTNRVGQLSSISIDCPAPDGLASFYSSLLGREEAFATPDRNVVSRGCDTDGHPHARPPWPTAELVRWPQLQQLHINVAVEDLDSAVDAAIGLRATLARQQPGPDQRRLLIDPVGHAFCVSAVRPD